MIRPCMLAAAAVLLVGGVSAGQPGATQTQRAGDVQPATASVRVVDSVEQLEAQLDVKRAHVKAAEVGVAAAKAKHAYLSETLGGNPVVEAKFVVETAQAQLDIRKAEVREIEVRIKQAKADGTEVKPAAAQAVNGPARSTVAVFNMAAVMRDFERAKYEVYKLNQKRFKVSANLLKWRTGYMKLQTDLQKETDAEEKEKISKEMLYLSRKIEDEEKGINKHLNDDASKIISGLFDEIQAVVDELAASQGYEVIFAYPDAVSPEEKANPYLKELKLKPPAAQPFFVARRVDVTKDIVKALNKQHPPLDDEGKKVDVNKLPPLESKIPPPPKGFPATPNIQVVPIKP